jgi:site-specific DNA recombinase
MSPTHARKKGIKYRYYLSSALLQGDAEHAGSMHRVPAAEIEHLVASSVRGHLKQSEPIDDRCLVSTHFARVEVQADRLIVHLAGVQQSNREQTEGDGILHIPWQKTPSKRRREILLPRSTLPENARPIRAETRATLVASIARGRRWLDELVGDPTANAESIAKREGCSVRKVNMTISLAFLAPDLVKAAIGGQLPHGLGVARLCDMPAEWSRQYKMLGLPPQ